MPFIKRSQSQTVRVTQRSKVEMQRQSSDNSSVFKDNEEKGDLKMSGFKTSLTLVVNDDPNETVRRQKKKPTGTDYSKLLSSLYGIALILVGFLFPLIDALSNKWLQLEFTTAFSVYLYSVATIFLIYLQVHLLRANHHKHHSSATTKNSHHPPPRPPPPRPPPPVTTSAEECSPIPSPITPTMEPNDPPKYNHKKPLNSGSRTASESEAPPAHTDTAKQRRHLAKHRNLSAMVRYSSTTNLNPRAADREFGAAVESQSPLTDLAPEEFGERVEEEFEVWIDMSKLGNIFSHEGSSFYLRLGSLFFGIGHLIYVCLELENSSYKQPGCTGSTFWWTYIFHLIFIVVQTFFLFKNQTVHIHNLKFVARFGAAHLIATNICIWLRTLTNEIMQEYKHVMEHHGADQHNASTTVGGPLSVVALSHHHHIAQRAVKEGDCPYYRGILQSASIYLFPFVLEYSLIAMGTTVIIYLSIDDQTKDDVVRGLTNFFKVQAVDLSDVEKADQSTGKDDDHGHGPSVLLKSHRGLFAGILLVVCSAVSITLFFYAMDVEVKMAKAELIYLTSDIVLHSILLLATAAATYRIHRLSYIAKPVSVDDLLLYLAMVGTLVLEISVAIAAGDAATHSDRERKSRSMEGLRMAGSIIASIQTIVQVILVMSGMRRYPSKASHVNDMPGRGLLTFLVVGNVAAWVFRTVQVKELSLQKTQSKFYGDLAWLFLMNVNLPLLLFYRFHSSICLADVWAIAYTPLHQKVPTPPEVNLDTSPVKDPRSSRLIRSISVPQLSRPVSERKLNLSGGDGDDGIDNKTFQLEGISHVSSVSSFASENF